MAYFFTKVTLGYLEPAIFSKVMCSVTAIRGRRCFSMKTIISAPDNLEPASVQHAALWHFCQQLWRLDTGWKPSGMSMITVRLIVCQDFPTEVTLGYLELAVFSKVLCGVTAIRGSRCPSMNNHNIAARKFGTCFCPACSSLTFLSATMEAWHRLKAFWNVNNYSSFDRLPGIIHLIFWYLALLLQHWLVTINHTRSDRHQSSQTYLVIIYVSAAISKLNDTVLSM